MPTICKITLDADEYKRELADVLAQSRAARTVLEEPVSLNVEPPEPVVVTVSGNAEEIAGEISQDLAAVSDREVSLNVVADTVAIARLEAAIAKLEAEEIELQVKVVDDDIGLLQARLNDITNKDVTITTEAEMQEAEKLRSVIAELENKKVKIRTEVQSPKLDQLRGQLDVATGKATTFGVAFRSAMQGNIGEEIAKGATAISTLGAAAGVAVPPVGMLAAVVNTLVSPIALVSAALTALLAIGMAVWDALTVSTEEYAEKAKNASEAAAQNTEKIKEQDQAAQAYADRLKELASIENAGNSAKAETAQILAALQSSYGDLGAVIDATTGKVTNLLEVEQRLNAERNKRLAGAHMKQSDAYMDEAKAAYTKAKGSEWSTSEISASGKFEGMRKSMKPEQMLEHMRNLAKNATRSDEISGYNEAVKKLEGVVAERNKAKNIAATGYESADARQKALAGKEAARGTAQRNRDTAHEAAANRQSDDEFSDLKDIDAKKANRQNRIDDVRRKRNEEGLDKELETAKADVAKARDSGDAGKLADALKTQYEIELKIQNSLDQEASLKRQMQELDNARAEAVKKIADQAAYELEYNKLIAAGEFQKAAALKLEKDLKDQNLKLTDEQKQKLLEQGEALKKLDTAKQIADAKDEVALQTLLVAGKYEEYEAEKLRIEAKRQGKNLTEQETKALLEQRKLLGAQNLKKSLKDQAYGVYGQAMEKAGRGREFAEEKALKDARDRKGRDLDPNEIANVKKITDLSWTSENQKDIQLGDTSVKTNSLTARGGFAGGAKLPDTEKINREISNYNKQQVEILTRIKEYLDQLENS